MDWNPPQKPAESAENRIIDAILAGHFPIGSNLPPERELAAQLGVTRPTLREALQRMARDGWVEIRHGKLTRVRDYWHEGNLGVLGAIARHSQNLPLDFVPNLLVVRKLLAPTYTRMAVERAEVEVISFLENHATLPETPEAYTNFDWNLHHLLTIASGNPVFTLILNGFRDLYHHMACLYFQHPESRASSRAFYSELLAAARDRDSRKAAQIAHRVMEDSINLWRQAAETNRHLWDNQRN